MSVPSTALVRKSKPKILMIFGPTASGKSGLALKLAKQLNGIIINADSRQIYAETPILTACPSPQDYIAVPHALYEFLPLKARFSAAEYADKAGQVIEKALVDGFLPIVVGGTGFYLRALLGGLSEIPASDERLEAEVMVMPQTARYAELGRVDPVTAVRLHENDTQRVVRALVVWRQTGKALSAWQTGDQKGEQGAELPWEVLKIGLMPPREVLHANIAKRRREIMPALGLIDELKALVNMGYTGEEAGLNGLANGLLLDYARTGTPPWDEVTQKAIEADRQYAKRQCTWLKNSYFADLLLESPDPTEALHAARVFLQR
jgi:tRNA dimethylallyltransferase